MAAHNAAGVAPTPDDGLALYSSILTSPPGAPQQLAALSSLKQLLESNPSFLPVLYPTLVGLVSTPQCEVGLVRKWVAEIIALGLSRPMAPEERVLRELSLQSTDPLLRLMSIQDPSDAHLPTTRCLCLQALTCLYTPLFSLACSKPSNSRSWDHVSALKTLALKWFRSPEGSTGLKVAAVKFAAKVVQVGTKGTADPRRRSEDPSLANVPNGHAYLKARELEAEAERVKEDLVKLLYSTQNTSVASAIITCLGLLVRQRPVHSNLLITALASWPPTALSTLPSNSLTAIKGVEKNLRIVLSHLERGSGPREYNNVLKEALLKQAERMRIADVDLQRNRAEKGKRLAEEAAAGAAQKRQKLEEAQQGQGNTLTAAGWQDPEVLQALAAVDVRATFSPQQALDMIIEALRTCPDEVFQDAIERGKTLLPQLLGVASQPPLPPQPQSRCQTGPVAPPVSTAPPPLAAPTVPDPLKTDFDEDDEELRFVTIPENQVDEKKPLLAGGSKFKDEPEEGEERVGEEEEDEPVVLGEFELPAPEALSDDERIGLLRFTLEGLLASGTGVDLWVPAEEGQSSRKGKGKASAVLPTPGQEGVWVSLMVRLATRGLDGDLEGEAVCEDELKAAADVREEVRQSLYDFVTADWAKRLSFARVWLSEEWYTTRTSRSGCAGNSGASTTPYERWLTKILEYLSVHSQNADAKSFSSFLLDLPLIPPAALRNLEAMCLKHAQLQVGFGTLREVVIARPPARVTALDVLLGLATHSKRQTRNAAIVSLKSFLDTAPLAERVVAFAVKLLEKVAEPPLKEEAKNEDGEGDDMDIEAGEEVETEDTWARVEAGELVTGLPPARKETEVVQYLELLLALSVKEPSLLDHLFRVYPTMPEQVQETVPNLITPLIRLLGPKSTKIISLISKCPAGSEPLVLRMLTILTDKGRAAPPVVEALRNLAAEQDLSPRFIIPIIAELDKADICRHLPRIVSLLNGTPTERALVRGVLESVTEQPPQNFGSVSTNAPRVKQSELLTPVELLALLHHAEKETGLRQAIEAIGVCFSMTDVFKPEVLAAFMQQVVDEPTLPTLFLRTVIQAVQTYKALQPFVSTTLLSRLIIKKVWTQPQLWEGFIRCAKIIAPYSFASLLQLPRDQLKEVVGKQPALKAPLKDYVIKKAGNNRTRMALFLEILGEGGDAPGADGRSTPQPQNVTPPPGAETALSPVPAVG